MKTKNKAYEIIKAKGATYFGIAAVVSSIAQAVLMNQKHIRPLSVYDETLKCCLSLPAVIGRNGIERIMPTPLNESEKKQLTESGESLRKIIDQYEPRLNK
jgi:L-lactate dehydrogenase